MSQRWRRKLEINQELVQEQQTNNQPETERRCQRGICATITIRLAQLREIATNLHKDFTLTEKVSRLKVPTYAFKFKTLC